MGGGGDVSILISQVYKSYMSDTMTYLYCPGSDTIPVFKVYVTSIY